MGSNSERILRVIRELRALELVHTRDESYSYSYVHMALYDFVELRHQRERAKTMRSSMLYTLVLLVHAQTH
jgi:hypothetical protein